MSHPPSLWAHDSSRLDWDGWKESLLPATLFDLCGDWSDLSL